MALCGFAICGPNLFCDLRTLNFRKSANRCLTNIAFCSDSKYKLEQNRFKITTFSAVLRQSCAVLCRNVRIWDLRINQENVADLQFADFLKNLLAHPCLYGLAPPCDCELRQIEQKDIF